MTLSKRNKQIIILYLSTVISVGLGVLSSIINTHFLSPTEYGDVRYVINIINFISSFLLFGYFLSGARLLALSNDDIYCRRIKGVMVIILATASAALMFLMGGTSLLHKNNSNLSLLILLAIPVSCSNLFMNYIEQTAAGDNQMGRLALARSMPYVCYVPLAYFIYSHYGCSSTLMILLQLGIYSIVYLTIIISTKPIFGTKGKEWTELKNENKTYGIQLYWGSLIMVATNYLAGITLGIFNSDNTNVGFYTLALTVTAPLALLPSIIGTSYFKQFATQNSIPTKVIKVTILLTVISGIAFILLIQPIVTFLYSERYSIVGIYASFLAIGYCIHGLGDMFNKYLCSHGQGIAVRNASFANGGFKIFGFVVLVAIWNVNGAIATVILCDIIYFMILILYYYKYCSKSND